MKRYLVALLLAFTLLPAAAWAHKGSDSYLTLTPRDDFVEARWDLALRDLETIVGLDADGDGSITWGELKAKRSAVESRALSRLRVSADGEPVAAVPTDLLVDEHSDGTYAVLMLRLDAPPSATLSVTYDLLFDRDPTHRGLVRYDAAGGTATHVLSPEANVVTLDPLAEAGLIDTFVTYVGEGFDHLLIGLDHVLFVVTLLIPAVLVREAAGGFDTSATWRPVERFWPALLGLLKILTVFTLAHSLTLWLATAGWVRPPTRVIESLIALSIVVAAVLAMRPVVRVPGWGLAFGFGLIHGFGFANVLLDLGLGATALAVSLLGFNVGVELGQAAVAATLFLPAFAARRTAAYRWVAVYGINVVIILIGLIWVAERTLNLTILGI